MQVRNLIPRARLSRANRGRFEILQKPEEQISKCTLALQLPVSIHRLVRAGSARYRETISADEGGQLCKKGMT